RQSARLAKNLPSSEKQHPQYFSREPRIVTRVYLFPAPAKHPPITPAQRSLQHAARELADSVTPRSSQTRHPPTTSRDSSHNGQKPHHPATHRRSRRPDATPSSVHKASRGSACRTTCQPPRQSAAPCPTRKTQGPPLKNKTSTR